jgi:hypothetical protein
MELATVATKDTFLLRRVYSLHVLVDEVLLG